MSALGRLAARLVPAPTRLQITYAGRTEALDTRPLTRLLVAALLGPHSGRVTPVNALQEAAARGLHVAETLGGDGDGFDRLLRLRVVGDGARTREIEATLHRGPRVVRLDGVEIEFDPQAHVLLLRNEDRPGMIGTVGSQLGAAGINIVNFALGAAGDGQARAAITVDRELVDDAARRVARDPRHPLAAAGLTMRILLARHGETPWNAEGRYQGQEDIALSPVGEAQARALGERLRDVPITRAVASPLQRARAYRRAGAGRTRPAADARSGPDGNRPRRLGRPARQRDPRARRRPPARLARYAARGADARKANRCSTCSIAPGRRWRAPARDWATDDTLLVVAHDAVNRVLLCRVLGMPLARLWTLPPGADHAQPARRRRRRPARRRAPQRLQPPHAVVRRSGASGAVANAGAEIQRMDAEPAWGPRDG